MISSGIDIVVQKQKGSSGPMEIQSYRFKKERYSEEESKSWLKKHDISPLSFEAASSS